MSVRPPESPAELRRPTPILVLARRSILGVAIASFSCGGASRGAVVPDHSEIECSVVPYVPPASGVRLAIVLENTLSPAFALSDLCLNVDGYALLTEAQRLEIVSKTRAGAIPRIDIVLSAGRHTLDSLITLRGSGQGEFAYLKDYKFEIRSRRGVGGPVSEEIHIILYETDRGPLEEKPAVQYRRVPLK